MTTSLDTWLNQLGYSDCQEALYTASHLPAISPYATEIESLLLDEQEIHAGAIFAVDGVPTVCFIEAKADKNAPALIESIRRKIWNQNLISLILVVDSEYAQPIATPRNAKAVSRLGLKDAVPNGLYSALDVISGNIKEHLPEDWFAKENRVDDDLLRNLSLAVQQLVSTKCGLERQAAQYVLSRCLFISFLEHRSIVGQDYRARRQVGQLHNLVSARDRDGIAKLLSQLKDDFNGNFLQPNKKESFDWRDSPDSVFTVLADFLGKVDLESGQQSFWAYDFRHIPVELISGIYETFLASDKKLTGAYYTPRHLANFAVDQAFAGSNDICAEIVYDGACGSGILLATAYRRMLRAATQRKGDALNFAERCELLLGHIRGSDIDDAACHVSAFSLYLCLLENLEPIDIALLQDNEKVKLPPLLQVILLSGREQGDFFSEANHFAQAGTCTIYLSNPPWAEPKGEQRNLAFENWADTHKKELSHRQLSIAFAHKAPLTLKEGGRFCLILNAKPFLSRTSQDFLKQWLTDIQLRRLINFSDIRHLLFPAASHPCVMAIGNARTPQAAPDAAEEFEYWTPKSDVSLAFGRLTVHGIDRHRLQTAAVKADNQRLRSYFWGGAHDHALISRLRLGGIVDDMLATKRKNGIPRWIGGKGFHANDQSRTPHSPGWLSDIPFYNAKSKPPIPLLDPQLLDNFPIEFNQIASFGAHDGRLFRGSRVIFNDGASSTFEPQAFFSDKDFSFQHSVGAFQGPGEDGDLLRFFAAYLRSKLAKYLLLHTSYALATERTRVTMQEVGALPFMPPERHQDPASAKKMMTQVAQEMIRLEQYGDTLAQYNAYDECMREKFDELIFDYFGLNKVERSLVNEVATTIIPSVQPGTLKALHKPALACASATDVKKYAEILQNELRCIQAKLGGTGSVCAEAIMQLPTRIGPIGLTRIVLAEQPGAPRLTTNVQDQDQAVIAALTWLKNQNVLPMPAGESFNLASDFLFFWNDAIYLAKPLVKRFWLASQALQDSRRVLEAIRTAAQGQGGAQ